MTAAQGASSLARAGLVRSELFTKLYLKAFLRLESVQAGPHLLQDDMSLRTLVRRLKRTPGGATVRTTIPEGFDKFDVAARLNDLGVCSEKAFLSATTNRELLHQLRLSTTDVEGYLFPATYQFPRNHRPDQVIRRMVLEADRRFARIFDDHVSELAELHRTATLQRHDVIVLASLVEKEAAVDSDRPLVASVFLNRLRDPNFRPEKRLQSDPTARYGCLLRPDLTSTCASAKKGVTGAMTRDPLNPYSTYAHSGLPPGPIANPGEASIRAVLKPAKTDFYYFVAQGNGRHAFSKTYDEHKKAVQAWRSRQ